MQGYSPNSDEFMSQDPEHIDEYQEWQRFAKFLVKDEKLNAGSGAVKVNRPPENRRRLKRYLLKVS